MQQSPKANTPLTLVPPAATEQQPAIEIAERPTVVHAVAGRPAFLRIGPVIQELERLGAFRQVVVDLCHPDVRPTADDLKDIGFGPPDHVISPGAGSSGERTARMLTAFEAVLRAESPVLTAVAGDDDAALASALAAAKLQLPVAYLGAGMRTGDWSSGEEINRVLVDRLADVLVVAGKAAYDTLCAEGVSSGRIHHAGSTVVDWLRVHEPAARLRAVRRAHGLGRHGYVLVLLHRRATIDGPGRARHLGEALRSLAARMPVVLPLHPRLTDTLRPVASRRGTTLTVLAPLTFLDYVSLAADAGAIVTDSGSVQEEASALGVPCFTLRTATEQVVTLTHGTNVLLGDDPTDLDAVTLSEARSCAIPMWDGHAAERVAEALVANFSLRRSADAVF